jgi:tetratricopeptide (TPR) repeat protein
MTEKHRSSDAAHDDSELVIRPDLTTVILALSLIIPMGYLVYHNFTPREETPKDTPAAQVTTSATTLEQMREAAEAQPSHGAFIRLGLAYYNNGDYQRSVEATKWAILLDSTSAVAYNNLAAAYGALGMWEEEIEACRQALAIDPDLQLAKNNLKWARDQLAKQRD